MLTINVAPDGSGQFTTISEAVLAVPYDCPAVIRIAPGIYREKLVCEKKEITLAGAGMDATRLVWNDGGKLPHPDGRPTHTFRSYTAFFSGEKLRVEDMTIENDAGPGAKAGQAIAAYVDSARAAFSRVRLLACKGLGDQLFNQGRFAGTKEAGEDIDFSHVPNASFFLSQYSQLLAQRAAEC